MCNPRKRGRDSPAPSDELRNVAATPAGLQRVHLVFHQRDQRRNDHGQPGSDQRGQLEAERFAAAGRQHGEDILAGERVADDFLLQRTKRTEAEKLFSAAPIVLRVELHARRIELERDGVAK